MVVAMGVVLTAGALLLHRAAGTFETSVRQQQAESLRIHVNTTHRAIDLWFATNKRFVERIAARPRLVGLTQRLLRGTPTPAKLAASPVLAEIREVLQAEIDVVDGRGIFILGPGDVSFASLRDANLGVENFLVREHPAQIRAAWSGATVAIPPVRSDVPLGGGSSRTGPVKDRSLFLAAPIRGAGGGVIAVLTVRYDARKTIDRILNDTERGFHFDAYAFDEGGRFVTEPRDADGRLRAATPRASTLWYLDARVAKMDAAGGPGEPTLLAQRAVSGGRGQAPGGYESYGGRRVIGAWAWNERLNLGLAAEVDEAAALEAFAEVYGYIRLLALAVMALSLGMAGFSLVHRHVTGRQERALRIDAMTGIACRGHFDERIAAACRAAGRDPSPLSLILLDVDAFKSFNDLYGHPAGDDCLRSIARCLERSCQKPADLAARYGGEEFAVLLPDTAAGAAGRVAEDLRRAIAGCAIPHRGSPASGVVTASLGVVTAEPRDLASGPTGLIERADRALYRAKASGRDAVIADAGGPATRLAA
ncbi:hypothetical protein PSMK_18760 [Phycisphaera mikurensis NBRC 102666]|uniref:diguanylate cyclase n=1 Tax=Phycisphaera mikurensis (strain NBRC 102666 / KCTC 22515 / FYK2301M01) TaxID=1142394 RepID=I0IFJ7_PHYMF|nr:hypothetical protein PSMK_18760 [Phycisphaera mikurensis NBRC 102666]